MTLARTFGRPDVDGLLEELTPAQFREWRAMYALDPWGPERDDLRMGMMACVLQVLHGHAPTWTPTQFVMFRRGEEVATDDGIEDADVQAEKLRLIAKAWGA